MDQQGVDFCNKISKRQILFLIGFLLTFIRIVKKCLNLIFKVDFQFQNCLNLSDFEFYDSSLEVSFLLLTLPSTAGMLHFKREFFIIRNPKFSPYLK